MHELLSIDEKLKAKLEKVFQLNFGNNGKIKVRTKAIAVDYWPKEGVSYGTNTCLLGLTVDDKHSWVPLTCIGSKEKL